MGHVKERSRMNPDIGFGKSALQFWVTSEKPVNARSLTSLEYKMRAVSCTHGVCVVQVLCSV